MLRTADAVFQCVFASERELVWFCRDRRFQKEHQSSGCQSVRTPRAAFFHARNNVDHVLEVSIVDHAVLLFSPPCLHRKLCLGRFSFREPSVFFRVFVVGQSPALCNSFS
jgi:hypothetical protein